METPPAGPYRVHLVAAGPRRIDVIKRVRQQTGLGLREAHDLVGRAPVEVWTTADADVARRLVVELCAAGAAAGCDDLEWPEGPPQPRRFSSPSRAAVGSVGFMGLWVVAAGPLIIHLAGERRWADLGAPLETLLVVLWVIAGLIVLAMAGRFLDSGSRGGE